MLTGKEYLEVKTVEVGRQWCNIDIWAEINDDVFFVIEGKTGTTIHDDQLRRYKKTVEEKYPDRAKYFAYVKTGNEPSSILQEVENAGYRIVLRKDILGCLDCYHGSDEVLCNYRKYLRAHEEAIQSFTKLSVSEWG